MRRLGLATFFTLILAATFSPHAARAQEAPPFDWRGFYAGAHAGAGLGLVDIADPFGPSIFGDTVRTPGPLAGAQAGYNWQYGAAVFGLEADASLADLYGTNTCLAYSGFYLSSNCRAHIDALGTLTGRLGFALPDDSRTLIYGKAGLAWEHIKTLAEVNAGLGYPGTSIDGFRWGWALGAGAERALTSRWSLKAEYDYLSFSGAGFAAPASGFQIMPGGSSSSLTAAAGAASSVSQDVHRLTFGVNYRLGQPDDVADGNRAYGSAPAASGLELELGARYVHGWGRFHKDLGIRNLGVDVLRSRLTYHGMRTDGQELFGRLDTPFDVMVKGIIGAGKGASNLNDEDWGLGPPKHMFFIPYSNTRSDGDNRIRYGIIDVGYDWWRDRSVKLAPFVGYGFFKQDMKALGCLQIANPNSDCARAVPTHILTITENDTWRVLRLGAAVDLALAPRLKLKGDVAYLAHVSFKDVDNHHLRSLISPGGGTGTGVQLEAVLSYAVTDALSLGIGGRYWSMWTTNGYTDFGGTGTDIIPMRYAAEQAAILVQGSYTFSTGH